MDFAEIHELDHIIVPNQTNDPTKLLHVVTEEELVNVFKSAQHVFNFSPKPSTKNADFQILGKKSMKDRRLKTQNS